MKATTWTTLTLLLATTAMPLLSTGAADGQTLVVGLGEAFARIQDALDAASPGDTVLVQPGTYQEALTIATPGLTLRGASRTSVVLDGGGFLGNAVTVVANGVTVQSMTARDFTSNGFVFSRVTDFRMLDLHAIHNGGYGLYAIHSTRGEIAYSFAEGHDDSGFYIGETVDCDCDVHHNVGWNNMLGYSGTANSRVRIWENEFYGNRAGILMSVLPNEMGVEDDGTLYGLQVGADIHHNYVHDNNDHTAASGIFETISPPVGEGIVIAGGWNNRVHHNVLENNALWGVGVYWLTTPPRGNIIEDNIITGSRYGIWWDEWGEDNCFGGNVFADVEVESDPSPLPACQGPLGPLPCPATDLATCRASDARAPSALKETNLAWRALTDADPHEDPL